MRDLVAVPVARNRDIDLRRKPRLRMYHGHVGRILRLIFTLFVLKANFPASEQFRSRLDIAEIWVITRTLQFTVHNIFESVIGDDVMVSPLVFYRNRLLH